MFHVRDGIKAKKSCDRLYAAMDSMPEEKPLDQIRVSDLCTEAGVSRSTFYRNFDSPSDILYWKCDRDFREAMTGFVGSDPDLSKDDVLLAYMLDYWLNGEHLILLERIMNADRADFIYNGFVRNGTIITDFFTQKNISVTKEDYTVFISVRAGFFYGLIHAWIDGGKKQTPRELTDIVMKQFYDVKSAGLLV